MKRAIIVEGPSGIGKSSVCALICKNKNFVHCDTDEFKLLFSKKRSKDRSEIGAYTCYAYTRELIKKGYNVVIEAIPEKYIKKLELLLQNNNYKVNKIALQATLEQCLRNNAQRKRKGFSSKVIQEVYDKYSKGKGDKIDITGKSVRQVYNIIEKKYF